MIHEVIIILKKNTGHHWNLLGHQFLTLKTDNKCGKNQIFNMPFQEFGVIKIILSNKCTRNHFYDGDKQICLLSLSLI